MTDQIRCCATCKHFTAFQSGDWGDCALKKPHEDDPNVRDGVYSDEICEKWETRNISPGLTSPPTQP